MNERELVQTYSQVQSTIKAQFEEIEAISDNSDNKDIVIEKLALQNQYLFGQYANLYAKSITTDDLAHVIDLSAPEEQEIKQYVAQQVTLAFHEKAQLEIKVAQLSERIDSISKSYSEQKQHLEQITQIYGDIRMIKSLNLPNKKKNQVLLTTIMKEDMLLLKKLHKEERADKNKNTTLKHIVQYLPHHHSLKQEQNDETIKPKKYGISVVLRENQREIQEELKKRRDNEQLNEQGGYLEAVKGGVQRLKVIADEMLKDNITDRKVDLLKKEIGNLEVKLNENHSLNKEEEEDKWKQLIEKIKKEHRDNVRKLQEQMEDREGDYEEQINLFVQEEDSRKIEHNIELENINQQVQERMRERERDIIFLNRKLQEYQMQAEEEGAKREILKEEYESSLAQIREKMKLSSEQQNQLFQREVQDVERKLKNMIEGREEYEIIVKKERDQLLKDKEDFQREKDKLDRQFNDIQVQNNKLRQNNQNLEIEIKLTLDQLNLFKRQIEIKDEEGDEMQVTFNELEAFSKKQLEVIQSQQAQLIRQEKNQQYKSLVKISNEELQKLKADFSEVVSKTRIQEKELVISKSEITRLQQKISSLVIEIQDLNQKSDNNRMVRFQQLNQTPLNNNEIRNYIQETYLSKSSQKQKEQKSFEYQENQSSDVLQKSPIQNDSVDYSLEQIKQLKREKEELLKQNQEFIQKQNELMYNLEQASDQNERSIEINIQLAQQRTELDEKVQQLSEVILILQTRIEELEFINVELQSAIQNDQSYMSANHIQNEEFSGPHQANQEGMNIQSHTYPLQATNTPSFNSSRNNQKFNLNPLKVFPNRQLKSSGDSNSNNEEIKEEGENEDEYYFYDGTQPPIEKHHKISTVSPILTQDYSPLQISFNQKKQQLLTNLQQQANTHIKEDNNLSSSCEQSQPSQNNFPKQQQKQQFQKVQQNPLSLSFRQHNSSQQDDSSPQEQSDNRQESSSRPKVN